MKQLLADISVGNLETPGALGNTTDPAGDLGKIISTIIAILTVVAGIWFLFIIIIGAIEIMGSGGDKGKFESAKKRISTGVVGLILAVAAIFIIEIVSLIIGIPDILNISGIITNLTP